MPCPINGMFLSKEAEEAKNELENDPDIVKEPTFGSQEWRIRTPDEPLGCLILLNYEGAILLANEFSIRRKLEETPPNL